MSVKLLTEYHLEFLSLKERCTGSSESTLVKIPHCWKSHVTAQMSVQKHIYSHWAVVVMSGCWDYDLTRNLSWTAMYSITPGRRQSKTSILSTNVDQKLLETEFSIVICRPTGDKWQSKTPFLSIFDPHLSIVKSVFDCRLPGVRLLHQSHIESDDNTDSGIYFQTRLFALEALFDPKITLNNESLIEFWYFQSFCAK